MTDSSTPTPRPVALIILDGYGYNPDPTDNAILAANTPVMDRLWETHAMPWFTPTVATWGCRTARWAIRRSAT